TKIKAQNASKDQAATLTNNEKDQGKATATHIEPVTITSNATKTFPLGKNLVLWTATDGAGNKANATQIVDVVDTTPPKVTPPKDIKAEATSLTDNAIDLGNATATDIEPVTITSNATKTFPLGKNLVLWTAIDGAGNKANTTQIVDVVDTTPPKLTPPKDITIEATSAKD